MCNLINFLPQQVNHLMFVTRVCNLKRLEEAFGGGIDVLSFCNLFETCQCVRCCFMILGLRPNKTYKSKHNFCGVISAGDVLFKFEFWQNKVEDLSFNLGGGQNVSSSCSRFACNSNLIGVVC